MSGNFVLGTANFGTRYGISNGEIVLQENEIAKIVQLAENSGLFAFDTAPSYGNAESQLGLLLNTPKKASIFTKISSDNSNSVSEMILSATKSLERAKVSKFSGIYLHNERIFESNNVQVILAGVRELLDSGITERVGISVYSIDTLLKAKDICPELNLFQVPENICDRRLFNSDELKNLAQNGDSIFIRSIFLQGLLLMELDKVPKEFSGIISNIEILIRYAKELNVSREALCLSYARNISWATGIILGVASLSHLESSLKPAVSLPEDFEIHIPSIDSEFLDPRNWPKFK
jgi:aryl-alcohol dehydrogenase-like predicted oxidoreductase